MSEGRDKYLMRAKDIVLIIGAVGGLVAGLGKLFVLANVVEVQQKKMAEMEPKVIAHETRLAVTDTKLEDIQKGIETILRKMDRLDRRDR